MTITSPQPFHFHHQHQQYHTPKRKYTPDLLDTTQSPTRPRHEISPRIIKKHRPNAVSAQSLRGSPSPLHITDVIAKTVSRLFEGQRMLDRGDIGVDMTLDVEGDRCAFCEAVVDPGLPEMERMCTHCQRTVCGMCGVRQYLHDGDYIACLECVHDGPG